MDDNDIFDDGLDSLDLDLNDGTEPGSLKKNSKRAIVEDVSAGFLEGVTDDLTDPNKITDRVKRVLPDSYETSFSAAKETANLGGELYNDVYDKTKQGVKEFKRSASSLLDAKGGFLPESISNRLKGFLETEEDSKTASKEEIENSKISAELGAMFGAQMEAQIDVAKEESLRSKVSDLLADKRHEGQQEQLFAIRQNISRQVTFQDTITARYQRKSIELKYRQLYVSKDIYSALSGGLTNLKEVSLGILKNTALPEFRKIQLNEASISMFRDSVLGNVQSGAAEFATNYLNKVKGNIKEKVSSLATTANDMLLSTADSISGGLDMAEDMGGINKSRLVGGMVGGVGTDYAIDKLSPKVKAYLDKNEKIKRYGLKANTFVGDIPRALNDYARSGTERNGILGWMETNIKDILQGEGLDNNIKSTGIEDSKGPAIFDNQTRKSIVEIIPGFLSRIHSELVSVRSGMGFENDGSNRVVYDLHTGRFSSKIGQETRLKNRLVSKSDISRAKEAIRSIVKIIDPNEQLSGRARLVLEKRLISDNLNKTKLDFLKLSNKEEWLGEEDSVIDEITNVISDTFNITSKTDKEGNVTSKIGSTLKIEEKVNTAKSKFNNLYSSVKDPLKEVEGLLELGDRETLEKLGFIKTSPTGDTTFNYDKLISMYTGEDDFIGPTQPKGGGPTGGSPFDGPTDEERNDIMSRLVKQSTGKWPSQLNGGASNDSQFETKLKKFNVRDTISNYQQPTSSVGYSTRGNLALDPYSSVNDNSYENPVTTNELRDYIKIVPEKVVNVIGENRNLELISNNLDASNEEVSVLSFLRDNIDPRLETSNLSLESIENALVNPVDTGELEYRSTHISLLSNILENVNSIAVNGIMTSGAVRAEELGTELFSRARGAIGSVFRGYGKYLKGVGKLGLNLAKKPIKFLKAGFGKVKSLLSTTKGYIKNKIEGDLFLKGDSDPRILLEKLKKGLYIDSETGLPIYNLKDLENLKGNLIENIDGSYRVILTKFELKDGLFDSLGTKVIDFKNSFLKTMGSVGSAIGSYIKSPYKLMSSIGSGAKSLLGKAFSKVNDIYIPGTKTPVLLASILRAGGYFNAEDGSVITSIKDIKGDVVDKHGNVILSIKDMREGLVDKYGNVLEFSNFVMQKLNNLYDLGKKAVSGGVKAVVGIYKAGYGLAKKSLGKVIDMVNNGVSVDASVVAKGNLSVLVQIRDILDERLEKRNINDSDNDGLRDGGWRERFKEKEEEDSKEESKESIKDKAKRMFSAIPGMGFFSKKANKDTDSGEGDLSVMEAGGLAAMAMAAWSGAKSLGSKAIGGIKGLFGKGKEKASGFKSKGKFGKLKGLGGLALGKLATMFSSGKDKISGIKTGSKGFVGNAKESAGTIGSSAVDKVRGLFGLTDQGIGESNESSGLGVEDAVTGIGALAGLKGIGSKALPWLARAGLVATGVVSLPALLIGSAAIGIATGGYFLYKKYASKIDILESLRFTQYGFSSEQTNEIAKVVTVEETLFKYLSLMGGKVKINLADLDLETLMSKVSINSSDPKAVDTFKLWLKHRFLPVFMANAGTAMLLTNADTLVGIGKRLKGEKRQEYLDGSIAITGFYIDDIPSYEIRSNPFNSNVPLLGTPIVNSAIREVRESITVDGTFKVKVEDSKTNKPFKVAYDKESKLVNVDTRPTLINKTRSPSTPSIDRFVTDKTNSTYNFIGSGKGYQVRSGTKGSVDSIPLPNGDGSYSAHKELIAAASKMVGVDPGLMATMAAIESGFNSKAKAKTSSATGLYQFIKGTWKTMLKRHGAKYGLDMNTSPLDPRANALMGAEFLKENSNKLRKVLKRDITDTDVYLAHFLGAGGASKFLTSDPNELAFKSMPSAARANKSIFYSGGRARTMGEVYQLMDSKVSKFRNRYADDARQTASSVSLNAKVATPKINTVSKSKPISIKETIASNNTNVSPVESNTVQKPTLAPLDTIRGDNSNVSSTSAPKQADVLRGRSLFKQQAMLSDIKGLDVNKRLVSEAKETNSILRKSLNTQESMYSRLEDISRILEETKQLINGGSVEEVKESKESKTKPTPISKAINPAINLRRNRT